MLGFYDIWVARDTNGSLFLKEPPYVSERAAMQRITQGLPFPVRCCWNGLVVLNAEPFLQHGARLRCERLNLPAKCAGQPSREHWLNVSLSGGSVNSRGHEHVFHKWTCANLDSPAQRPQAKGMCCIRVLTAVQRLPATGLRAHACRPWRATGACRTCAIGFPEQES